MELAGGRLRKVCVITSNRADWSKLRPIVLSMQKDQSIEVSVVAIGSHLLQEFGHTVTEIKNDFPEAIKVSTIVAGDARSAMVDSVGFGVLKLSNTILQLHPDICLIHGDRFDAFSAAIAANLLNITIAHVEGGELSGTVDGDLRHAITKLSHIHFACSEDAAFRIKAMGENSRNVHLTGCPSYERLFSLNDSSWEQFGVEHEFLTLVRKEYIIALMHPDVTDEEQSVNDYECFIQALFRMKKATVFMYPNVDPGNKRMIQVLHKYQKQNTDWAKWLFVRTHVPPDMFAVLMREAAVMIGNSSSGIRESCVFGTPTLNLGKRQSGRLNPANVTTYEHPQSDLVIQWVADNFQRRFTPSSEFGSIASADNIARIISAVDLSLCRQKSFHTLQHIVPDLKVDSSSACEPKPKICHQSNPRVLGIITARGGSKGILGKNIIDLGGKPLIQYTVEAALSAKLMDRCILSTDCEKIARIANDMGCEVPFMRPTELAQDDSAHMDCVRHAITTLAESQNYQADFVMILQPTSPFRTGEDIDKAISIIMETSCDAVVSVAKSSVQLMKSFHVDEESKQISPYVVSMPTSKYVRRQDSACVYSENGAIFVQRVSSVLLPCCTRIGSLFSEDVRAYIMPVERSLDVDEPYDLEMARALTAYRTTNRSNE